MTNIDPIDGTSIIGTDCCGHEPPATCKGLSETAGRLLTVATQLIEEPHGGNERAASILIRESIMWIQLLDRWSSDDPPEFWDLPKSDHLASLRDLASAATEVSGFKDNDARWVLDYLVYAIEERSCEIPQQLIDAVDPNDLRELDVVAGRKPEVVSRWISGPMEALRAKAASDAAAEAETAELEKTRPLTSSELEEREARIRDFEASSAKLATECRAELATREVVDGASPEPR